MTRSALMSVCGAVLLLANCEKETPNFLKTITVSGAPLEFIQGTVPSVQLKAKTLDQDGAPIDAIVTWTSSDPVIAAVDASGLVTPQSPGEVKILASSGRVSGEIGIHILPIPTLEEKIRELVRANAIPALAAAIVDDQEITWMKGFGVLRGTTQAPVTPDALFITSSVAKLVIGVAVMQQVEQGALSLDADVSTYLGYSLKNPFFPSHNITPRILMTHQTGLANPDTESPEITGFYADSLFTLGPWLRNYLTPAGSKYNAALWKNTQPGTTHVSSNIGMTILAHLVEKVTGKDFRQYAEDHIFSPLEMTATTYKVNKPGSLNENLLVDVFNSAGQIFPDYFDGAIYPAGLLRTSVKDWSKFMIAMINGGLYNGTRILNQSTVDEMLRVDFPDANLAFNSGIGLIWRGYGANREWLGHTGGGFISASTDINRTRKRGVVILSNGRNKFTVMPDPSGTIYNLLHEEALKP